MQLFSLGVIDPLLVERFTGFDYPAFVTGVRLLGDGSTGPDEVLQSSGIPMPRATITGVLTSSDCELLRGYDLMKSEQTFVDGNGNSSTVVVLELTTDDFVDWWTYTALLVKTDPIAISGS